MPAPQRSEVPPQTEVALLRRRLEFQRLLSGISSCFINLAAAKIDRHINWALGQVGSFLGFNLVAISKFSGQGNVGEVTHIWTAEELLPVPPGFTELDFPWCAERLTQGHPVYLTCLDDLPPAGQRDRHTYERLAIRSAHNWPLRVGGATVGCLGLASVGAVRPFPVEFEEGLELFAQVMASTLARQRADQALRESEAKLSLAASTVGGGLWRLDRATNRFWLTNKTRELFDFAADEMVTLERFLSRVHPDDQELIRQKVQAMVQSKNEGRIEYRIVRPDGSVRWILSQGRVQSNKSGEPDCLMGVSVDVTERKRAEELLRTGAERVRILFDRANDGIFVVSVDGKLVSVNESFARMHGYTVEEMVGIDLQKLDTPETFRLFAERVRRILAGEALVFEVEHYHKDGHVFPLEVSASRFTVAGTCFILSFHRNITEHKKAELEVQELRRQLAHADRVTLLGQLASGLAHELSQPLGAILRNAEAAELMLLEASPDLAELHAIVTDIQRDDQRAGLVIERLRSLLKRRRLDPEPIDLPGVIAEVLSLVHADATARQVKLACATPTDLPRVWGDRIHLQQVLLNLIINAMDALEGCAPHQRGIQVRAHRTDRVTVEVRVCDNGPGIPGESLPKLFEPFFTTKSNGMGMGLAVSKTIIEAHRGKLWAVNQPEGGTCFCFTLAVAGDRGQGAGEK